jgi:hypothetical protein
LIQCKDVSKAISIGEVRKFEAFIGLYPKNTTLGIFVSNSKGSTRSYSRGFSNDAFFWAKKSNYDILLTDISNLHDDLIGHRFKFLTENEEIKKVKEDISTIVTKIENIDKKLNENSNNQRDKDNALIFYARIITVTLLIFLILYVKNNM